MILEIIKRLKELEFEVEHTSHFLIISKDDKTMRLLLEELHYHWMEGDINGLRFSQPSHSVGDCMNVINDLFFHH